ncbi:hypothetical protein ANCCAN_16319 [Ancylostoma caninum]|uniref:Uncharacterized protein n=1 Tax=Ancylostoma caninum TaxID=29170 RepID=A0A368G247_ANCCA|nr:hypothetical protein ANCCAN_17724 [Ancylostoma caninum]RCN37768.1 hypothetical protein ANCCAN_16319 [Ancylostoma caninum]
MGDTEEGSRINQETGNIIKNIPSRISHISTFVSVTLIIVLIMVIAHVVRLIMGMQKKSTREAPSAIVIQPKEKPKKDIKKKKKASLACKHRSNYNLPSKTMMELVNPVTSMAIAAPPAYQTIQPSTDPNAAPQIAVPPLAKPDAGGSSVQSIQNSANQSPAASVRNVPNQSGGTIVSGTIKSETNATPSTTGGGK